MAHPEQFEFFASVRQHLPEHFSGARVLEVGALNISGTVRDLFTQCDYTGVDLAAGPGIDLACPGQMLAFPSGHFDTVISAECFEHNPYWRETFANMLRMCRPGGLVIVSCATLGRKEHGTTRSAPQASPLTVEARWDYYRNLDARDLARAAHLPGWLSQWKCWTNHISHDLYFVGLRQGGSTTLATALVDTLDKRYAFAASAKSLRRGLKAHLLRS
jgi:SAM-dependent methyltransferase